MPFEEKLNIESICSKNKCTRRIFWQLCLGHIVVSNGAPVDTMDP